MDFLCKRLYLEDVRNKVAFQFDFVSSNFYFLLKSVLTCLTLALLNKDATPTSNFQPIRLLDPDC